jgi:hypothetical protein
LSRHVGNDKTRGGCVHGDAVRAEIESEPASQSDDGGLRSGKVVPPVVVPRSAIDATLTMRPQRRAFTLRVTRTTASSRIRDRCATR